MICRKSKVEKSKEKQSKNLLGLTFNRYFRPILVVQKYTIPYEF